MNYSAEQSELSAPLIAVPAGDASEPAKAASTDRPQRTEHDEAVQPMSWCEHFLNLTLHVLLFFQFGIFFWVQDESVAQLSWSVVNGSIALYLLTTHLYRECLEWAGVSYDVSLLLPEFMIVVTMGLCFFDRVVEAFLLLIVTKLCLALTVVIVNSYRLFYFDNDDADDDDKTVAVAEDEEETAKVLVV